jgi:hypothetical protein
MIVSKDTDFRDSGVLSVFGSADLGSGRTALRYTGTL